MSSLMSLFNTFHFLLKFFCVIKFCLALVVLPLLLVVLVIVVVVAVVTSSGSNTVNCSCTSCCFCVSLRLLRPAATCRSGRNILYPLLSHPHILALTLSHIKRLLLRLITANQIISKYQHRHRLVVLGSDGSLGRALCIFLVEPGQEE